MKDRLFILIFFMLLAALLPPITRGKAAEPVRASLPDSFPLLLTETGTIRTVTPEDYLVGCLAAQIPIDYEQEALNAQAAASYTYALRLTENAGSLPDGALYPTTRKPLSPIFRPKNAPSFTGKAIPTTSPA